ncbi:MAG TPA: hypothetical protein VF185_02975 [Patescibacteria group bacterium]
MVEVDRTRNICNEVGCKACCCHDMWYVTKQNEKDVLSWFPKAVATYEEAMTHRAPGVYYCKYLDGYLIHAVGWCPNLDRVTRNCTRSESNRPPACSNFSIADSSCNESRKEDGFLPITAEEVMEKIVSGVDLELEKW